MTKKYIRILLGAVFVLALFFVFRTFTHDHFLPVAPKEVLRSLPYAAWAPVARTDTAKVGVIKYEKGCAYDGINVYCSEATNLVRLMDMAGNVAHIIAPEGVRNCRLAKPYSGSDFLVLVEDKRIMRLDWDARILWETYGWFHHDFDIDSRGDIYILMNRLRYVPQINPDKLVVDNLIVVLTPEGAIKKEFSFLDMVMADPGGPILAWVKECKILNETGAGEIFDTNALQIIDRDMVLAPGCAVKKGDILFSMKSLDIIGVVDLRRQRIVWSWGRGELDMQHNPTLLANGNILIFDNGRRRKYSRVVELDPRAGKVVWQYRAPAGEEFFSSTRGSAQRLANGNTLITESDKGRVFEVTPAGLIVWEFWSTDRSRDNKERGAIYRMNRYGRALANRQESEASR
ncbi:MAG TPA: arylsulfotransferase family protein [Patescibacteria group bacterium]|nr:arylsulfotransferase family protein [Patescibacteria group bacterium]